MVKKIAETGAGLKPTISDFGCKGTAIFSYSQIKWSKVSNENGTLSDNPLRSAYIR